MLELKDVVFDQSDFSVCVNWRLARGECLALLGPSGAGKSTILAGVAGFIPQRAGRVLWNGEAMLQQPQQRPVSMLFQDHNLFPHLTALQNVGLGIAARLRLSEAERFQSLQALAAVGLQGLETRKPSELSGGQQSRVALARILVMARPVILLDEPFAALGPGQRLEMLELVRELAATLDAVLIMVTHDPQDARALDGKVSFVSDGQASAPTSVEEFFKNPPASMQAYAGSLRLTR